MSRTAKDRIVMRKMCARLSATIDSMTESDSDISRALGYANPATIARMRIGETFLDSERLALFGTMFVREKVTPNLHWILTGQGDPVISSTNNVLAKALNILIRKSSENSSLYLSPQV